LNSKAQELNFQKIISIKNEKKKREITKSPALTLQNKRSQFNISASYKKMLTSLNDSTYG